MKLSTLISSVILGTAFLLLLSCSALVGPRCLIIDQTELIVPSFGSPYMNFTVKNSGLGTAHSVFVEVKLKEGNHIVDIGTAGFGTLQNYESRTDEAFFTDINGESDFSSMEITLMWWDSNGRYYED